MIYTQIRAFDAVAREGSFSRAAQALCLTQPAVTIQVRALEQAYGVKLLNRAAGTVTLTALGERVFRMTRQLASLEEQIHDLLLASDDLQGSSLRLAIDGPHIVMRLLGRFQGRYPGVELAVAMGNTQFVRRELLDRRADVAILPGVQGHPKIHAVPLWRHTAVLIVARNHPWASRRDVTLAELNGQPMIRREAGSMTQKTIDDALRRAAVKPRFTLELGSREAVCEAAGAGLGCGIIWDSEAQDSMRFATVPLRGAPIHSIDHVACLKSEMPRQVIQAFFRMASGLQEAAPQTSIA